MAIFVEKWQNCIINVLLKDRFTEDIEIQLELDPVFNFYPRDAMLARVFATATCLSVRPSVCHTPVLCLVERKQDREMYTIW